MFVLPVNRDAPARRAVPVTRTLIVANSLLWAGLTLAGLNGQAIAHFGLYPAHWTFAAACAHMFLHAGFWHVAGNMWFLWMFAPKLEERLGPGRFLLAYGLCGLAAAGVHTLFSMGSTVPMVGASGAISGVAGMYFVLFPRSPFDLQFYLGWWRVKRLSVQTRGAVGTWIGEQFLLGILISTWRVSSIAFWAHVGGFAAGVLIGVFVASRASAEEREALLHPKPYTREEREEIFADRVEQPSDLTTLKLGS